MTMRQGRRKQFGIGQANRGCKAAESFSARSVEMFLMYEFQLPGSALIASRVASWLSGWPNA